MGARSQGRGFDSQSGTGTFLLPFFSPLFPCTDCALNYPGVYTCLWQGPARFSGGPSSTINIPVVVYFAYGSTANFDFEVQLLRSIY